MKPHAQSLTGFAAFLFNEGVVLVETHPSSLLIMGLVTLLVSTYSLAFYIIYYFAAILGCWVILAVYSNFPLYLSTSSKKGIILGINSTESGGEGVVVGGGVGGKAIGGPDQKSSTSESAPFSSIKSPYSSRPFLWKSWLEKRQRERVVLVSRPFLDSKRVQKLIVRVCEILDHKYLNSHFPPPPTIQIPNPIFIHI